MQKKRKMRSFQMQRTCSFMTALLFMFLLGLSAHAVDKTFVYYKSVFEKQVSEIETTHHASLNTVLGSYGKDIAVAKEAIKKKGDLEGTIAANHEIERFEKEESVPQNPPAGFPSLLISVQRKYHGALKAADLAKNKKTAHLIKRYLVPLERLKKQLVQQENLIKAQKVANEIKRVMFISSEIVIAQPVKAPSPIKPPEDPSTRLSASLCKGLVLHYSFDEDKVNKVTDDSDNENHGRVVGPITYVDGVSGKGIRITTPDAYVESLAQGLNMHGWKEVTVSVWFKLERQTTYGTILSRTAIGGKKGGTLSLSIGGSSACYGNFFCSGNSVKSSAFSKGHPPPLGKWHHMTATVGPRVVRLYVNGILDAEHVRERPGVPFSDNPAYAFTIGKYRAHREKWRDSYPHGVLDEVKVWRRALSESEIEHIYKAQQ